MLTNIRNDFDLSSITWFKVGGIAKYYARPSNVDELADLLKKFHDVIILGNASNVLISDLPMERCVVKLSSAFGKINQIDDTTFEVGAACLDLTVASYMQENGISGMEFLATIPGTVGGNVVMNAGCFGSEIFDILQSITIMERNGEVKKLEKKDIECSYRHTVLPEGAVVLSATIKGVKEKPEIIKAKIDSLVLQRIQSQPQNVRTGGSTFKNPKGHSAWELIRQSGADKFKVGGAEVSEKHANFLINTGNATGQDIYTLGEEIRSAVLKHSGINLEWEIQMIGKF